MKGNVLRKPGGVVCGSSLPPFLSVCLPRPLALPAVGFGMSLAYSLGPSPARGTLSVWFWGLISIDFAESGEPWDLFSEKRMTCPELGDLGGLNPGTGLRMVPDARGHSGWITALRVSLALRGTETHVWVTALLVTSGKCLSVPGPQSSHLKNKHISRRIK